MKQHVAIIEMFKKVVKDAPLDKGPQPKGADMQHPRTSNMQAKTAAEIAKAKQDALEQLDKDKYPHPHCTDFATQRFPQANYYGVGAAVFAAQAMGRP